MTAPIWRKARESADWVGPIVCTVTDRHTGLPVSATIQFAVLPKDQRPTSGDWGTPYLDPDGTGALGVFVGPSAGYAHLGIWARATGTPEVPVLEPSDVGWVIKT